MNQVVQSLHSGSKRGHQNRTHLENISMTKKKVKNFSKQHYFATVTGKLSAIG